MRAETPRIPYKLQVSTSYRASGGSGRLPERCPGTRRNHIGLRPFKGVGPLDGLEAVGLGGGAAHS